MAQSIILKKPSSEEIIMLFEKMEKHYSALSQVFAEDEQYYELDFQSLLKIPQEFKADGVVLPTARDMVDTFVDHIDVGNARISVNKKGSSAKSEEACDMQRKFAHGLIHRTKVEADISPWRVAAKHYALHGLAIFKVLWDADLTPDVPKQLERESEEAYAMRLEAWKDANDTPIPIVIQAINPGCVYPDPSFGGREFVFEVHERTVLGASERYTHYQNVKGRNPDEQVKIVSFWSKRWHCEFVDNEPILQVEGGVDRHSYGFIPYVFIDTGLGNMSKDADPKKRYVGILRYLKSMLVAESRAYSIEDIVLAFAAWPWGYLEGDLADTVKEVKQMYGHWTKLPKGVKPVPVTPQVPPHALMEHLNTTSDYITGHAAPASLRGMPQEGVRSAADRRLMIAEGVTKYKYSEEAFRHGTAKVLDLCTRLQKYVIPGDIRVWAMTPTDDIDIEIKKDLLIEPFTYYVEFAPISEEDEYRRHDDYERLIQSGIVTPEWVWEQMSNVDKKAMAHSFEKWKIENDPGLRQVLSQYAMGLAMNAIQQRMKAEGIDGSQMAMPGMGGPVGGGPAGGGPTGGGGQEMMGNMTTGIPNKAQPGSMEAIQNALKQLRGGPMSATQGMRGGGSRI